MKFHHVLIGVWALAATGGAALLISALVHGIRAAVRAIGRHGLKVIFVVTLLALTSCQPSPDTVESTYTTHVTGVMK